MFSSRGSFVYDINTKKVTSDCNLYPTEVNKKDMYWLYAQNNKYNRESFELQKIGKWMLFLTKHQVNAIWDKIKQAVTNGDLWHSKVSTYSAESPNDTHAVMIYTKDYTDLNDVINVLDFLETSGIKEPHTTIRYKTDQQTAAGIYSGGKQKPWIYASDTIRGGSPAATGTSNCSNWRDGRN
ncbi:uncharacterized protein LOC116339154 [Contarinia nasturtii]|uniref:uncharacterized protein LOC116339154 n=1 Tax=Contarinia nasturtii TaxID=265458 RepID=UPI0012D4BCD3|nr:uncharacterized protein LOC116339154 [Contarinia nasturtii]